MSVNKEHIDPDLLYLHMNYKNPLHFNPLHIYRSILREASYHIDPQARKYLKSYAVSSFRTAKEKSTHEFKSWPDPARIRRENALLHRARQFLSVLRHANDGQLDQFRRTLDLTYGRRGPRRRQLMQLLMSPPAQPELTSDEPFTGPAIEAIHPRAANQPTSPSTLAEPPPEKSKHPSPPSPLFLSLLNSQSTIADHIPSQSRRLKPKGPEFPSNTIWGRPPTESHLAKAERSWFSHAASTLYPPLPSAEWEMLRAIATGEVVLERPTRRAKAKGESAAAGPEDTDMAVNFLARPEKISRSENKVGHKTSQTKSERWVRRQYQWLLRHVPLAGVSADGERGMVAASASKTPFLWDDGKRRVGESKERKQVREREKELLFG